MSSHLVRLDNVIRPYAWGSYTVIQDLVGSPEKATPAAELWMGAHPGSPSLLEGHGGTSLLGLIESNPVDFLGAGSVARFGNSLPFLLKVLAADRPLSIQAHPTIEQAKAGCADEDARGIPRDSPERNYVDANHKPELISALTDFEALCGFRAVHASADLLSQLQAAGADKLVGFAERIVGDGGLRDVVTALLTMPAAWQADLLASVLPAAAAIAARGSDWAAECGWAQRLADFYPGDPGVVLALLMNLVVLRPGEALFLSAGRIHAYLRGAGIELMASSDNVLRCGLTSKHVDGPELLRVLDFGTEDVQPLSATADGPWDRYPVPVEDFTLARLSLVPGAPDEVLDGDGPQILLVTDGTITVTSSGDETSVQLERGQSAFAAAGRRLVLSGTGELFLATTNLGV
jgi:mannose-6-phosphate isomerase